MMWCCPFDFTRTVGEEVAIKKGVEPESLWTMFRSGGAMTEPKQTFLSASTASPKQIVPNNKTKTRFGRLPRIRKYGG